MSLTGLMNGNWPLITVITIWIRKQNIRARSETGGVVRGVARAGSFLCPSGALAFLRTTLLFFEMVHPRFRHGLPLIHRCFLCQFIDRSTRSLLSTSFTRVTNSKFCFRACNFAENAMIFSHTLSSSMNRITLSVYSLSASLYSLLTLSGILITVCLSYRSISRARVIEWCSTAC